MHTLIYSSEVETYLGDIDISSLLYAARQSNAEHKVTGVLLHHNGNFIQVLEGEEETIKRLYETILKDRRHKNIKLLLEKEIDKRQFNGWDMGFKNITDEDLDNYPVLKSVIEKQTAEDSSHVYDFLVGLNRDQECIEAFY